jgi:hypothetical protein
MAGTVMAADFLTDAEMERLSAAPTPAPAHPDDPHGGDFISDEQMDAMAPSAPTISDDQMEAMANPDHAKVNEMIRQAISSGMSKDQILDLARQNGVDAAALSSAIDPAMAWRAQHGDYTGYVDAFQERPEVRTQPKADVGIVDAVGAGLGQGLTFGFSDEIGAGVGALANSVAGLAGGGTGEGLGDYYTRVRDENRDYLADAGDQHVIAYGAGQIAGSIVPAVAGGVGATGAQMLGRAALEGAAYGAGTSKGQGIGQIVADTATGAAVGGLTAGALNRVGAVVSPKVAPLVDRLLGAGVELTPTQMLKAGGPVSRAVAHTIEKVGRRGAITSEAMRGAEARARAGLDDLVARQDAAVAQARAAGLNATPRHPDLIGRAETIMGKKTQETTQLEMLGNLLLGYASSGGSLAGDLGLATIYTRPGQAVAKSALTGRQGPVPKNIRNILDKLSPIAGNTAAINTPKD